MAWLRHAMAGSGWSGKQLGAGDLSGGEDGEDGEVGAPGGVPGGDGQRERLVVAVGGVGARVERAGVQPQEQGGQYCGAAVR